MRGARRSHAAALSLAVLTLGPACSLDLLGDYEPGGAANLPIAGAGPFTKLPADLTTPADEPFLLADRAAHLSDPTARVTADGGLELLCGRAPIEGGGSAIVRARFAALTDDPQVAPAVVLEADAAWEAGWIGRPALVDLGGGELVLYYQGNLDAPAIGRAESHDDGATWTKSPAGPVLAAAADPGAGYLAGRFVLYVTQPDQDGVTRATSDDGRAFTLEDEVLAPRPALPGAFDAVALASPSVAVSDTLDAVEPERVSLHLAGLRRDGPELLSSLGFAASFDGEHFERPGERAVLAPDAPSEGGPAVVLYPTRAVLLYHELYRGRQAIAAAASP